MGVFTIDVLDTSPVVSYLPEVTFLSDSVYGPSTNGWAPYYTKTGFRPSSSSDNGESMHIAYKDQSRVSIDWTGTDIEVQGNFTNANYSIALDGHTIDLTGTVLPDGVLANISGLSQGPHTLALFAHLKSDGDPDSFVCFQKAVVTSQTVATVTTKPVDDHQIAFRGEWSFTRDTTSSANATFHTSTNQGDEALLSFQGSGIAVSGFTNITSGPYNVTLDGATTMFDGKATFAQPTVLFFQSGLDATKEHSLTITNAASALLMIGAIDVTTSSATPSAAAHGISRGTAAGIAIACVLAFLALLALAGFLFFRRRPVPATVSRLRQLFRRRPTYPDYESEFDGHDITFTRNEKAGPLTAPGEMSPGSMFFPPAVMPVPPRQYAPKHQRFSTNTWKSTLAPSDSYSAPPKRPSERRRGSKTLLLGSPQDDSPYLTFGRSGHRPPDIKVSSQPFSHIEVIDIRAPSIRALDGNAHSQDHEDSFLDIQSSASPSASATNTGSERSSRRVTRGSHASRPVSGSTSIPGGLKALFNRSSKASRHSRSGSGSTPSFPYPFEPQGIHGSVIDGAIPADVDSHSESDIHFRALEDMTDTDGMRTRPVSQPNAPVDSTPTTAIVQRLLGLENAVPASARIVRSPPLAASPAGPSAWPRALASGFGAGPLSPVRTNAPAGPRPPSIARR